MVTQTLFKYARTFDSSEKAIAWEEKVLTRMKVLEKENWLNQTISGAIVLTDESIQRIIEKNSGPNNHNYGKSPSKESNEKTK